MRGIVFTEFLDFVESDFGYEMTDQIIQDSALPHGGAYTSIGNYPHSEMATLLRHLSLRSEVPVPDLLRRYGRYFFGMLSKSFAYFFEGANDAFTLCELFESRVHAEVRKLYPDVELPRFETRRITEHSLQLIYRSERLPADFAAGLIDAILSHFGEDATISRENVTADGVSVRFLIEKQQVTT